MDQRAEPGRPVPERRQAVPLDDAGEIGVPGGELVDRRRETALVE